jgi:chemotaxis protein CheD
MITKYSLRFKKDITIIYPGEYFATNKNIVIETLLGTCISACLIDEINAVFGMNHFLLPYQLKHKEKDFLGENALYGSAAMELLINDMMKLGAEKKNLKAKIFGAGSILGNTYKISKTVTQNNINFIKDFLEVEQIPIVSEDVGGEHGRKIFLFTEKKGTVLLKRIHQENIVYKIQSQEEEYKNNIIKKEIDKTKIEDFKTTIIFGEDL